MGTDTERYTPQQLAAITAAEPNVLVSAAAGSGKTHVLSKRVELLVRGVDMEAFQKTGRETENPGKAEDISRMLILTFTRAAASEMRTRIMQRLTQAAQKASNPQDALRLHSQAEAAAGADITTFHGFCRKVIAENYEDAGVASGFTILSDSQASYLKNTCAREVLDTFYEENDPDVARLLERYGKNGDDAEILRLVVDIHAQMMGHPDWHAWLHLSLQDPEEYMPSLMKEMDAILLRDVREALRLQNGVVELDQASVIAGPKTQKVDLEYRDWIGHLEASCKELGSVRALNVNEHIKAPSKPRGEDLFSEGKTLRDRAKEILKEVYGRLSVASQEAMASDLAYTQADVRAWVRLLEAFEEKYTGRKVASNRLDFSDLEHRALQVLKKQQDLYAEKYAYIFVDEYQDTNPVQEAILQYMHPKRKGKWLNNQFLVGDMKQSIYGFRFADPLLFHQKSEDQGTYVIHMNDNFRSKQAVVDAVNALMGEVMGETLGGVSYTDKEKLIPGLSDASGGYAEILLAVPEDGQSKMEKEAQCIAERIEALHANGRSFEDIAVMYRTRSDKMTYLIRELENRAIPYASETGYGTIYAEIDVFLNLLRLLLNDRQDIPLLSVMRSFMFGFDEKEISQIVDWNPKKPPRSPFFWSLHNFYRGAAQDVPELHKKVSDFYAQIERLRRVGTDMPVARFAEEVADRVGFATYLLSRPSGDARRKMFASLLDVIAEQQDIHGNSMLRVLEAIDELKSRKQLFHSESGVPMVPGSVRLMTIHGSKGLEFPVVFLADCDKHFNPKSTQGAILRSDRFGVTLQYVDPEKIVRRDTAETMVVKEHIRASELSEELRVLYVALTRAKEELYICGSTDNLDVSMQSWQEMAGRYESAKSYLDWVMGAWCSIGTVESTLRMHADQSKNPLPASDNSKEVFDWNTFVQQVKEKGNQEPLLGLEVRRRIAATQNVSKLAESSFDAHMWKSRAPLFLKPAVDEITGSQKGTLMHRFLQYAIARRLDPQQTLQAMDTNVLLTPAEKRQLNQDLPKLRQFFDSDLYARLKKANRVLIEQRFRLPIRPSELGEEDLDEDEMIRLRGMIDLAFREGDEWVLVDYKSDRPQPPAQLLARYGMQVRLYKRAIEEITRQKVRECYLFLIETGQALEVPLN